VDYKQELHELVTAVAKEGASDLHLAVNNHPTIRVNGVLIPLLKKEKLTADDTKGFIAELVTPEEKERFFTTQEVDFSYAHNKDIRFR